MSATLDWYNANARAQCALYEAKPPKALHALLSRWIRRGDKVIELGCGSGRDARFMSRLGADVTATDGSEAMLEEARRTPSDVSFVQLALPAAQSVLAAKGLALPETGDTTPEGRFDAVVAIALLMHFEDEEFFRVLKNIAALVRENGLAILSFCTSHPKEKERIYSDRSAQEVILRLSDFGFSLLDHETSGDALGRSGIRWHTIVLRKSLAASKSRLQLQSVIFEDRKTATYKLALLRALCDIAQSSPCRVSCAGDDKVAVPLGLVIEKWIEYYWPLQSLKQIRGSSQLSFAARLSHLSRLFHGDYFSFRHGLESNTLDSNAAQALATLTTSVRKALIDGPITHAGTASGQQTFSHQKEDTVISPTASPMTRLLSGHGRLLLAAEFWLAMRDNCWWLNDSIVLQWAQLIDRFENPQAQFATDRLGVILEKLLATQAPERDTHLARHYYAAKPSLSCVWSGKALHNAFAVDHIIPWSVTRNNDLWNLMPASPKVNSDKSDRIPGFEFFYARKDALVENWRYLDETDHALFAGQIAHSLMPDGLSHTQWWNPLFDAVGERLESIAQRLSMPRWSV